MQQPKDDLIAAYALGALSTEEHRKFEETATEDQLREAQELEQTAAQLAYLSTPEAPSDEVKRKLMEQVRQTPQLQAENAGRRLTADSTWAGTPKAQNYSEPQMKNLNLFKGLFALAVCSALIAGAWGYSQYSQLQNARNEISSLQAQATASPSSDDNSLITQINQAPDMSFAQGSMGNSLVSVVYSPSHNMASISSSNLPVLPEGKVYMIWLYNKDHQVVGSGTLNDSGPSSITEMTNQDLSQVTDFGITVEDSTATSPSATPMMLEAMGS